MVYRLTDIDMVPRGKTMTHMEFVRMVLLELRDGTNNARIDEAMARTAAQERDHALLVSAAADAQKAMLDAQREEQFQLGRYKAARDAVVDAFDITERG